MTSLKWRRRVVVHRAAVCAALTLAAAGPAFPAAKGGAGVWSFDLRGEAEVRYDDNILGLSNTEKDLVDPNDPGNAERFRVETPDDFIFNPSFGFGFSRKPRRGRQTDFGAAVSAHQYFRNNVKNYHQYSLWARQDLNRSRAHRTTLLVGGARIPSYYLRQLVDDDETTDPNNPVHNAAAYELSRGYVEIGQEIVNRYLSVDARYARERRDYNHHFRERDSSSDVVSLDVNVYPAGGIGFRIRPYYEHERRDSRGDLSTSSTVTEDDVGFDADLFGLELRGLWGKDSDHRNVLRGYYERESRDFESDDPGDATHFNREDRITKIGAAYGRDLSARWRFNASGYHRDNDVSVSRSKFRKNVVQVSFGYAFDRAISGGGERAPRAED